VAVPGGSDGGSPGGRLLDRGETMTSAPRSVVHRLCWTAAASVFVVAPYWALVGSPPHDSPQPSALIVSAALLPAAALMGALGDRVSYHWSDAVFVVMGPWSLVVAVKLIWRVTLLPYRDWPAREEEAGDWRRMRGMGRELWIRVPPSAALPSLATLTSPVALRRGLRATGIVAAAVVPYCLLVGMFGARLPGGPGVAEWALLVLPAGFTALIAPRASYRARDALAWIVPPFGLVLLTRLAWRIAGR
jgi:hypothetical protein